MAVIFIDDDLSALDSTQNQLRFVMAQAEHRPLVNIRRNREERGQFDQLQVKGWACQIGCELKSISPIRLSRFFA
jgi:hypothetical protein